MQVTYKDKHRQQTVQILVNDNPAVECGERRGAAMEISCHTAGLLYLEQGDRVSLQDGQPGRQLDTAPGKTFFGLVKLTADWI